MGGTEAHVNFNAPAVLCKWPSLRNVSAGVSNAEVLPLSFFYSVRKRAEL